MTTLSRTRRLTTLASASILVASATVFGALPAMAAPGGQPGPPSSDKATYAALGDSYAAGVGGGDYLDACLRSTNGYAADLASDPGLTVHASLRGCVGATVDDVVATQLGGLDLRTRLVTLTVGANDLGLDAVTAACLAGTVEQCAAAVAAAQANLEALAPDLAGALAAIRTAAPNATVLVTGYPLLLDPSIPQSSFVNGGVLALNAVIQGVVTAAGPGFEYVDVTGAFAGHGIGSADPWIIAPPSPDAFHPNPAGYDAYAAAIRAAR
jgi:lysophospholipase L1-like esterase